MLLNSLLFIIGLMAVDALPLKRQQATKLGGVNLAVCPKISLQRVFELTQRDASLV